MRILKRLIIKNFYRDIFPIGSFEEKDTYVKGKYNGIIVEVTDEKKENGKVRILRYTLTDNLDILDEVVKRDNFSLMSPISYAGKARDSSMARELYALAVDVDGLISTEKDRYKGIRNMIHQMHGGDRIPLPTYIVSSSAYGRKILYAKKKKTTCGL